MSFLKFNYFSKWFFYTFNYKKGKSSPEFRSQKIVEPKVLGEIQNEICAYCGFLSLLTIDILKF